MKNQWVRALGIAMSATSLLAGCGGGGGGGTVFSLPVFQGGGGGDTGTPAVPPVDTGTTTPPSGGGDEVFVKQVLTGYVNPFVGTADSVVPADDPVPSGARGGTFPGATTPFGMVQWTPMTPSAGGSDKPVGYIYKEKTIVGFPLTQMSGSGCSGNGGEFPIMPTFDPATVGPKSPENFDHKNEEASPGYYKVTLNDGITTELTTTTRTGAGRFTFPAQSALAADRKTPFLVIDATRSNQQARTTGVIEAVGKDALWGSTRAVRFCAWQNNSFDMHDVYFYAKFDRDITADTKTSGKAVVSFDASARPAVLMKIGLSYVSRENARKNLEQENPGWDFDGVRKAASQAWNDRLNVVQTRGGTEAEKRKFYTALYHSLLSPNINNDVTGEYRGFDRQVHQVEAGRTHYINFSSWDTYRSLIPMTGMLFPKETGDMMQSLVVDADQCGGIPRWGTASTDGAIMPGDSGVPSVGSAYAFGATNFDAKKALGYMTLVGSKTDLTCNGGGLRDGKERMNDYLVQGYSAMDNGHWAGALTFEFAVADFATAQLAKALGDTTNHQMFLGRSANWKNQFNTGARTVLPRWRDGSWKALDSVAGGDDMVEGNPEQYTWMAAYDTRALFHLAGGNGEVVKRLDKFFQKLNAGTHLPNYYAGNEPSFNTPWLYNWAGAPWRTQKVTRDVINTVFFDEPGGLPGNDDLGAVSSWYAWAAMGLYPAVQSVGGLTIGSPMFDQVVIRWADGTKKLSLNATGAGTHAPYIQSLKLNGQAIDTPWVSLKDLGQDSKLDFVLGTTESQWGKDSAPRMPSFGLDGFDSLGAALNNRGIGTDGKPTERGLEGYTFDMGGWSYSAQALATAGATTGGTVSFNGMDFKWPDGKAGLDNTVAQGQTITLAAPQTAGTLALLGSATGAAAAPTGKLTVTYDDGTSERFDLRFDEWTLGGGGTPAGSYNKVALTTDHRVGKDGKVDATKAYVYYWDAALDRQRKVRSVTLPFQTDNGGLLHVFAMALK